MSKKKKIGLQKKAQSNAERGYVDDPLMREAEASVILSLNKGPEAQPHCADCRKLKLERIHDLNQIGGLQQELALLHGLLERLDWAIYEFDCKADTRKCHDAIDSIVHEYRKHCGGER